MSSGIHELEHLYVILPYTLIDSPPELSFQLPCRWRLPDYRGGDNNTAASITTTVDK
jgi:hypothetical protein